MGHKLVHLRLGLFFILFAFAAEAHAGFWCSVAGFWCDEPAEEMAATPEGISPDVLDPSKITFQFDAQKGNEFYVYDRPSDLNSNGLPKDANGNWTASRLGVDGQSPMKFPAGTKVTVAGEPIVKQGATWMQITTIGDGTMNCSSGNCYVRQDQITLAPEAAPQIVEQAAEVVADAGVTDGKTDCENCGPYMAAESDTNEPAIVAPAPVVVEQPEIAIEEKPAAAETKPPVACFNYPGLAAERPHDRKKIEELENGEREKFFEYLKPIAQKIQSEYGLPASVFLAQAAIDTGYGTSKGFRKRNAAVGHWCAQGGREIKVTLPTGETKTIKEACDGNRVQYESIEDSAYAYAWNLIQNQANAEQLGSLRGKYRDMLVQFKDNKSPRSVLDRETMLSELASSSETNAGNVETMKKIIKRFGLDKYDSETACPGNAAPAPAVEDKKGLSNEELKSTVEAALERADAKKAAEVAPAAKEEKAPAAEVAPPAQKEVTTEDVMGDLYLWVSP